MRKGLYLIVLAVLLISLSAAFRAADEPQFVEGELLLQFKGEVTTQSAERVFAQTGARALQYYPQIGVYHVRLRAGESVKDAVKRFQSMGEVVYAEPNYIYTIDLTPNDPNFSRLWGLENTGQTGGLADADIDASAAWDVSTGSEQVIVGVVDTGIDFTHPDLAANIYTNPGEDAWANPNDPSTGNGIDDDGNGKIDDWRGWNFITNTNNAYDDNMHGTHCAGTIGAVGDNGIGVVGVNWRVKMMPLKFLDSRGSGSTAGAVDAIIYAANMGVHVLSNSWGGGGFSTSLENAIKFADGKGVLFVAAAGNDGTNNDITPNYPSNYEVPNVIAVAATDHGDKLAIWGSGGGGNDDGCGFICASVNAAVPGSNYGVKTVHLAAPGKDILSTVPGTGYSSLSGTSMATPHVSGAAALLLAVDPNLSVSRLKTVLLTSVDKLDDLTGKVAAGGRLNIAAAVAQVVPKP